jgi:large subunit ribosomal protein L21
MYAIVKVGGKQYRVEEGDSLLVDRMREDEGAKITLEPLLLSGDKDPVFDADGLAKVKVEAVVTGHERGKKIRVVKFKPKRGYKRTAGHRSELTRLEIRGIKQGSRRRAEADTPAKADTPAEADAPAKADTSSVAVPWAGYDDMTVPEILERLEQQPNLKGRVRKYETAHQGRKGVLEGTETD